MPVEIITAPGTRLFERAYLGEIDQPRRVRADLTTFAADCPAADDLVLLASELSANAVQHSLSGGPDGEFTVRAEIRPGNYVWLEVEDQGGEWLAGDHDDEHGRGLAIVAAIAGDGNWGVESGNMRGPHVVWARLDWPASSELPAEGALRTRQTGPGCGATPCGEAQCREGP
jgi:anti-sigma regulatory factor (Ser/Thr protein kinase)